MAAQTPFASDEIRQILATYDLGSYRSHRPFPTGADQTNYRVETSTGSYAFRYYEKRR